MFRPSTLLENLQRALPGSNVYHDPARGAIVISYGTWRKELRQCSTPYELITEVNEIAATYVLELEYAQRVAKAKAAVTFKGKQYDMIIIDDLVGDEQMYDYIIKSLKDVLGDFITGKKAP